MKDNLAIYNKVRKVPAEAQKPIKGGRLKGMTDINPMWRIKTLTEQFGPAGQGWYYEILEKRIEEGANNEKVAFVDINLFVKFEDEWSKPIQGTGGSSFVTKERSGFYTSDECFKMALTDAISVACKALGIGADVYFKEDRSKYNLSETRTNQGYQQEASTVNQRKAIYAKASNLKLTSDEMKNIMKKLYKKNSSKKLTKQEASDLLDRLSAMEQKVKKQ